MLLSGIIGLLQIPDNIAGIRCTVICPGMTLRPVVLGYQIPFKTDTVKSVKFTFFTNADGRLRTVEDLLNGPPLFSLSFAGS